MQKFFLIALITCITTLMNPLLSFACHKGGPMGFAKNDPGMFTVDVSSSTSFATGSTFGTSGCKNWDLVNHRTHETLAFLTLHKKTMQEEAAQGKGVHLGALAQLMGCDEPLIFATVLHEHYPLFLPVGTTVDQSPVVLYSHIKEIIHQNASLSVSCLSKQ